MSPGRVLVLLPAPLFRVFSCFSRFFPGFFPFFPFFASWYKDQEQFQEDLCAYIYIYINIKISYMPAGVKVQNPTLGRRKIPLGMGWEPRFPP